MKMVLCTAFASLLAGTAFAQQANVNLDFNPQKNTENLVPFSASLNSPDVRDDRTVTFRLKAPEARNVSLAGVAVLTALGQTQPVPFQKGSDGLWTLTVGPLAPDMYVYHLLVDGVQMADPNNTVGGVTAMPPYSQLVVHGPGPAYYDARDVPHGTVSIQASFNNTKITITDAAGNVIAWSSSGSLGFKGSRKGTPFAAQQAATTAAGSAREHGLRSLDIRVKGPGSGRESAIRALQAAGVEVKSIRDVTPIPHNGCRPPKRRRV